MKQKVLLLTAFAAITYLTLTSNKGGAGTAGGGNRIGVTGIGSGTCGSPTCHTSGVGTTGVNFEVRKRFKPDSNGLVNSYYPDSMYTVHLFGSHTTLPKFGYQLMAIKFSDTTTAGAILGFDSLKSHAMTIGGRIILESVDTISKTGSQMDMVFKWKAPSKNSGAVRFHAMVVACNGDGNAAGDQPSATATHSLAEAVSVSNTLNELTFNVYPNPVTNNLHIQKSNASNGYYQVQITDVTGKALQSDMINVSNNTFDLSVNTIQWASGLYFVTVSKDDAKKVVPVVK
jgi:hypothetical protein